MSRPPLLESNFYPKSQQEASKPAGGGGRGEQETEGTTSQGKVKVKGQGLEEEGMRLSPV